MFIIRGQIYFGIFVGDKPTRVKTMIKYSQKVVTLATSSKTNTAEAFFISPVSELYMLITDANPEDNANKAFRDLGIKVL